tara:strand:- start:418 stop:1248 length:831 start_codon:yes stop_codon:yes gene_type:complete
MNVISKEMKRVYQGEAEGWDQYREVKDKYDLDHVQIEALGEKRYILKLRSDQNNYEMLQCSRGISVKEEHGDVEALIDDVTNNQMVLDPGDLVRANELEKHLREIPGLEVASVAELGFRIPRLLKYYQQAGKKAVGYDVVNFNVLVGKQMGYDARHKDLNDPDVDLSDLSDFDLVISYHVLEHVSRPDLLVEKIFQNMKDESFFHVEVPIEPEGPVIRYGHLFPFHKHDLFHMLQHAGFYVGMACNTTHPGGGNIERYLVKKTTCPSSHQVSDLHF